MPTKSVTSSKLVTLYTNKQIRMLFFKFFLLFYSFQMFIEPPSLVVIDEYPTPLPFVNPICKDTYEALPKIYGKRGKRKYIQNVQQIIKHDRSTIQRQSSRMEIQNSLRSSSGGEEKRKTKFVPNMEIAQPKSQHCKKKNCWCNLSKMQVNTFNEGNGQGVKPSAKLKKIMLPHLGEMQEIKQSQSSHKIYQAKRMTNLEESRLMESRMHLIENRFQRLKELRQSKVTRSQYIQTENFQTVEPVSHPTIKKETLFGQQTEIDQTSKKKRRYDSEPNQINKPYYQYIENDPKFKKNNEEESDKFQRRRTNPFEDQVLTISSITIKNQSTVSTIFHQFKKKQSTRKSKNSQKKSQSHSVLSNGLFKIPEADEYEDYLSNYAPMNPEMNVKKLISKRNFQIVPTDKYVYFGQVSNDKKEGEGIMVSQKEIYEGKYENNIKVKGYQKNRDGVYSGHFLNGKRHGNGKYVWNNGEEFEGEWRDGKKNGFGIWRSPKGDYYEGQWKDNRQHGKGYYIHFGGSKYRGYFKDFLKSGKGSQEFQNGDKYSGSYQQGKPHGYGKYTWANGDCYQGEFIDGSRQGKGVFRKTNGEVYQGEFKNDSKHGMGTQKYKSGQQFIGQFKEGQRFRGKMRTKNGVQINITDD